MKQNLFAKTLAWAFLIGAATSSGANAAITKVVAPAAAGDRDRNLEREMMANLDVGQDFQITREKSAGAKGNAKEKDTLRLSGTVANLYTKLAVAHLAQRKLGAGQVINTLKIAPVRGAKRFPTDQEIESRVRALFAYDSFLGAWDLSPTVKSGRVTLRGQIPSEFHRLRAARVSARATGVTAVANRLEIASKPLARRDADVGKAVRESLRRNAITAREKITVRAEAGVVELRGQVHSWEQAKLASQVAYARGAKIVRNKLAVSDAAPRTAPKAR